MIYDIVLFYCMIYCFVLLYVILYYIIFYDLCKQRSPVSDLGPRKEGEGERRRGGGKEGKAAQSDGQTRRFQMPKNLPVKEGLQKNVLLKQVIKSLWVIQGSVKG